MRCYFWNNPLTKTTPFRSSELQTINTMTWTLHDLSVNRWPLWPHWSTPKRLLSGMGLAKLSQDFSQLWAVGKARPVERTVSVRDAFSESIGLNVISEASSEVVQHIASTKQSMPVTSHHSAMIAAEGIERSLDIDPLRWRPPSIATAALHRFVSHCWYDILIVFHGDAMMDQGGGRSIRNKALW